MLKKVIKTFVKADSSLYKKLSSIYYWWRPRFWDIDQILKRYNQFKLERGETTKFIQIGSNDGISNDPIRDLILGNDWEGVVIEPVAFLFNKLPVSYKNAKGNIFFENCAISNQAGLQPFYEIKEQKNTEGLPYWYDQLSSFNKEVILKHKSAIPNIEDLISEVMVQTNTIENVLNKYSISHVDVIHMDTEGYDAQIIEGIDFSKISPDIVLFENRHLSLNDFRETCRKLMKNGYRNFYNYTDTLAIKVAVGNKLKIE